MSSFAESKAMNLAENDAKKYIKHNQFQLSRTYPSGFRTDSSNYHPAALHNCGCQIGMKNYKLLDKMSGNRKSRRSPISFEIQV